jgi:HU domain fused to wHTH, Ig, or Glycine-rich motif
MAKLIQAVTEFGPRIALGRTAQTPEIAEMIASRTSMNAGEVGNTLSEFKAALLFYAKQGQPVKLEGLGTFTPTVDLEGNLDVGFRLDTSIDGELNVPGAFKGEVLNRENIGKASADLKALWNAEHPTDPIP